MPPQRFAISFSPCLTGVVGAFHIAGAAVVAVMPLANWGKAALILFVFWSLKHCVWQEALLRAPDSIIAVNITREGRIVGRTRRGDCLDCELLPSTFVSYRLTILNLRDRATRRIRHVVLCSDNVDAADFRRLRAWLRWAAEESAIRGS